LWSADLYGRNIPKDLQEAIKTNLSLVNLKIKAAELPKKNTGINSHIVEHSSFGQNKVEMKEVETKVSNADDPRTSILVSKAVDVLWDKHYISANPEDLTIVILCKTLKNYFENEGSLNIKIRAPDPASEEWPPIECWRYHYNCAVKKFNADTCGKKCQLIVTKLQNDLK